mmetsp:Transcript_23729/g.53866  ORF Transcript_23729/g.53866 Transcript_23729/m.53866 type:complete len:262 (-) Transcript_23729:396-1181(-)
MSILSPSSASMRFPTAGVMLLPCHQGSGSDSGNDLSSPPTSTGGGRGAGSILLMFPSTIPRWFCGFRLDSEIARRPPSLKRNLSPNRRVRSAEHEAASSSAVPSVHGTVQKSTASRTVRTLTASPAVLRAVTAVVPQALIRILPSRLLHASSGWVSSSLLRTVSIRYTAPRDACEEIMTSNLAPSRSPSSLSDMAGANCSIIRLCPFAGSASSSTSPLDRTRSPGERATPTSNRPSIAPADRTERPPPSACLSRVPPPEGE